MNFNNFQKLFVFLLIIVFYGCAITPSVQRIYEGDSLAKEKVITIIAKSETKIGGITRKYSLLKVDDKTIEDQNDLVEILPGIHVITVQLEKIIPPKFNISISFNLYGNKTELVEPKKSIVITAKKSLFIKLAAGKKYMIAGKDNLEGKIYRKYGSEFIQGSGHWRPKIREVK
ncbi:hypothetical protein K8R32_01135 [bacterium]|nr:hypothetical protein [bacterium]